MLFEEKYKSLNKEQKLAVDTIEGPVMVIAGPGTGKTSILTLRIANILQKTDTPASGILALTFTEQGQKEMQKRVRDLIGAKADEVGIYTYHGFASSVIKEFPEHFPHIAKSEQITEIERDEILRGILKNIKFRKLRPLGDPDFYIYPIIEAVSNSKRESWTPEIVKQFATDEIEKIKNDEESISSRGKSKGELKADAKERIEKCEKTILFAEVYAEYEKKKSELKKIDYDDLIFELTNGFKNNELLLRLIQEKYLYILVDEHQDTNDTQNELIKVIADFFDTPNLFVVGDEKQGIFRFQGASVENFLKFQKLWGDMKIIPLKSNYRSHQSILDASFSMIGNNYSEDEHKDLRIKLSSENGLESKPIDLVYAGNDEAHDKYIVDELKSLQKTEPNSEIAIIVKRNRDVEKVLSLLDKNGLKASADRGVDIFTNPIGILIFSLFEALSDDSKTESLAKTIVAGLWNLPFQTSVKLIKEIRSGKFENIEKEVPGYLWLCGQSHNLSALEFVIQAMNKSGLINIIIKSPVYTEVWRGIYSLLKDISVQKNISDFKTLINEILAYKLSSENKSLKISIGSGNEKIRVMTAHGSKGLEFDYVFLPYAVKESWMTKRNTTYFVLPREKESGDEEKDYRRLFYVALTRAKKHVSILVPLAEGLNRELTPIPFIEELDKEHISRIDLPKIHEEHNSTFEKKNENSEILDLAKKTLTEFGLSPTALNHFIECPSKFIYKSILKLPEPPSGSSEKGNAMHFAMQNVWALTNKSEENITNTICDSIKTFMQNSLLIKHDKESIVEELLYDAPKIAWGLKSHFETEGKVFSENKVESSYKKILLNGKLDAMIDRESETLVFDYKTSKSMSLAKVKGETKDGDGNYFRQLTFYKLLLADRYKKNIETSLIFLKPEKNGEIKTLNVLVEKNDIDDLKSQIDSLIDSVWSGKILTDICEDKNCEFCGLKNL